eukprot:3677124-Alexandrium_andersonii.AAC.1
MSASLVGSEMCIRDSFKELDERTHHGHASWSDEHFVMGGRYGGSKNQFIEDGPSAFNPKVVKQ